ncbi:hypothetical protein ASG40_01410 [Methylobacterium sp. Leaf399]|uniref:hypothetical protein n=1 Tax=unclassified Methylobacterium TaxID=2615210 RepID=UPI0006F2AC46|nr:MULTISPECIES: hypothetical protein [unclassified Methylobacterium]KQP61378.1 hypothetical protein ASF39_01415 [Methylobacterium sp. Leaf108]KQT19526.1 hypothetical protein ASG40_01410 [Methylobacterium sp. Leaf399]KQT80579.1 hypothetical protein ASG59_03845 [Methylobacterium sp. Leaf466]
MRPAGPLLAALLLVPAGCSSSVDRQRATTCRRAVPALAPPEGAVTILRVAQGPGADSVRVDYGLGQRDGRQRWLVCRFGTGAVLDAISTEQGPVSGAALYLLRHYYLDTSEAVAADPQP